MKKIFLCCVLSALVGGAFAAWLIENDFHLPTSSIAVAQELRGPAVGAPANAGRHRTQSRRSRRRN